MVCVPCFIIPVLLVLWRLFIQPILLRFWNPWQKKDEEGNVIKSAPEFPFQCKGDTCPFPIKKSINATSEENTASQTVEDDSKKDK